jgi:hypothetical protein
LIKATDRKADWMGSSSTGGGAGGGEMTDGIGFLGPPPGTRGRRPSFDASEPLPPVCADCRCGKPERSGSVTALGPLTRLSPNDRITINATTAITAAPTPAATVIDVFDSQSCHGEFIGGGIGTDAGGETTGFSDCGPVLSCRRG